METKKEKQMLIAAILLDIGMEDELVSTMTHLSLQEFQHLKNK